MLLSQRSKLRLQAVREDIGYSREYVVRRPELDPPISSKTLERYEKGTSAIKKLRLRQLARVYGVKVSELVETLEAAA